MTIRTIGLIVAIFLANSPLIGAGKGKLISEDITVSPEFLELVTPSHLPATSGADAEESGFKKVYFDFDTPKAKTSQEDPHSTFVTRGVLHDDAHYYIKEEYGPITRILTMTPQREPLMSFEYKPKKGSHIDVSYYPLTKEYTGYLSQSGKSLMTATLTDKLAEKKYAELEKMFNVAKAEQQSKTQEILQKLKSQKDTTAATGSSK